MVLLLHAAAKTVLLFSGEGLHLLWQLPVAEGFSSSQDEQLQPVPRVQGQVRHLRQEELRILCYHLAGQ